MRVLVTGAGGFLGSSLSRQLINCGYEVIGLARGHYPHLEKIGIKMIRADLKNSQEIKPHFENIDACFHTAGKVAMWGRWEDFYQTNVMGTQNVIQACREKKVPYLIYTSSPSVIFGNQSIEGADENLPYPKKNYSFYAQSKALAEQDVLQANTQTLKTLSLRPHLIFGPGDKNLVPRLVESAKKGRLKIIGEGHNRVDVVYIENASEAHRLALEKLVEGAPVDGKAYFIGQGPVPLWTFINQILEQYKVPPIEKKISFRRAFWLGHIIEKFLSLIGQYNINPPMTRFVALQMAKSHYYNHERAHRLLGWRPTIGLTQALEKLNPNL